MTATVSECISLYIDQQGRPFPGPDGKIAEFTQVYGEPGVREVVRMMGVWVAAGKAADPLARSVAIPIGNRGIQ